MNDFTTMPLNMPHPPLNHNKLKELTELVNDLSQSERYAIPYFLLRCQFLEFNLKYLYNAYGFLSEHKDLAEATLGTVIRHLKETKDSYLDSIIEKSQKIKGIRNRVTHHLIDSDFELKSLMLEIKVAVQDINEVEQNIWYYFEHVRSI